MLILCRSSYAASICSKKNCQNSKLYTFLEKWGGQQRGKEKISGAHVPLVPQRTATDKEPLWIHIRKFPIGTSNCKQMFRNLICTCTAQTFCVNFHRATFISFFTLATIATSFSLSFTANETSWLIQ